MPDAEYLGHLHLAGTRRNWARTRHVDGGRLVRWRGGTGPRSAAVAVHARRRAVRCAVGTRTVDGEGVPEHAWRSMKAEEFERRVLRLWTASRVPMTRPNVQAFTGASRDEVRRGLDDLVVAGALEMDSDDAGEAMWTVPGAARSPHGPTTVAEFESYERIAREVSPGGAPRGVPTSHALVRAANATGAGDGPPRKSVLLSGALSFFLGPVGWLYSAPFGTAVPAALGYMILASLIPHSLLLALLSIGAPISAIAGAAFAWRFNQRGRRAELWAGPDARALPPPRRDGRR